jgi:hypothetical protein
VISRPGRVLPRLNACFARAIRGACMAFAPPLAARAGGVGFLAETGAEREAPAFFSRVGAGVLPLATLRLRPELASAGLCAAAFALADVVRFAAALADDRPGRGIEAVRAFLAFGSRLAASARPRRDLVADLMALVLRDFPIFLTDDIRGALLCSSALETEHSGKEENPPADHQADPNFRIAAQPI